MLRFYASTFIATMRDIEVQISILNSLKIDGDGDAQLSSVREHITGTLTQLLKEVTTLPLSPALPRKIERLIKRAETDNLVTITQVEVLLKELYNDILDELATAWFLMVPASKRWLYEQPTPLFGKAVERYFAVASYDIAAAGRCFALYEWTRQYST